MILFSILIIGDKMITVQLIIENEEFYLLRIKRFSIMTLVIPPD